MFQVYNRTIRQMSDFSLTWAFIRWWCIKKSFKISFQVYGLITCLATHHNKLFKFTKAPYGDVILI